MAMGTDTAQNLRHIAEQGELVHLMDWKAICANAGSAANELERLRAQNTYLADSLTKIVEDVKCVLRKSTAEIVEIGATKFRS